MASQSAPPNSDSEAPDLHILTDPELVRKAANGDQDAFGVLVGRYQKPIVTLIHRMVGNWEVALELGQEVFVKVYGHLSRYDQTYKFSTWLYRIASNRAIDHLRRRRPYTISLDEDPEHSAPATQPAHPGLTPEQAAIGTNLGQKIHEAIDQLPPHYRELIILRHLLHRSYTEIALITELPLGTVKNRIHRARLILQTKLEKTVALKKAGDS